MIGKRHVSVLQEYFFITSYFGLFDIAR